MARKVKCRYCGQEFDRECVEYVKLNTRYAHASCHEAAKLEAKELKQLTDLIQSLYYPKEPNWGLTCKQIQKYKDEGMTYMGMYYTLTYFFIVQKNDIHKSKGIGIIPYVYDRAKNYYKNINNIYTKTAEIQQKEEMNIEQTENIITIRHQKPRKKLMDFTYSD